MFFKKPTVFFYFRIREPRITFATQSCGRWNYVSLKYNSARKQITKILRIVFSHEYQSHLSLQCSFSFSNQGLFTEQRPLRMERKYSV